MGIGDLRKLLRDVIFSLSFDSLSRKEKDDLSDRIKEFLEMGAECIK